MFETIKKLYFIVGYTCMFIVCGAVIAGSIWYVLDSGMIKFGG